MEEIWKDIKGYERFYRISNTGKVYSVDRVIKTKNDKIYLCFGKELKFKVDAKGYIRVTLCKNGTNKSYLLSRLVADHYLENPNNYEFVNHKDENKLNNCDFNLEWCTRNYNNNYGTRGKRIAQKLNKKVCYKNGSSTQIFESINEASNTLGYGLAYISMCCNGKRNPKKYSFTFI